MGRRVLGHAGAAELTRAVAELRPGQVVVTEPGEWRVLDDMRGWEEEVGCPVEIRPDERLEWNVEAEFIGAIRGQNEVRLTDFATAVRYMEFTDAVAESAKTGQRIEL